MVRLTNAQARRSLATPSGTDNPAHAGDAAAWAEADVALALHMGEGACLPLVATFIVLQTPP